MALSTFPAKEKIPLDSDLKSVLEGTYNQWKEIIEYVKIKYPGAVEQWNYGGEKYGWGFRLRDKKRVIVYLMPGDGYFTASLLYGEKATAEARKTKISATILNIIETARVYAEGRGIRIEVHDSSVIDDIKSLIQIKLNN